MRAVAFHAAAHATGDDTHITNRLIHTYTTTTDVLVTRSVLYRIMQWSYKCLPFTLPFFYQCFIAYKYKTKSLIALKALPFTLLVASPALYHLIKNKRKILKLAVTEIQIQTCCNGNPSKCVLTQGELEKQQRHLAKQERLWYSVKRGPKCKRLYLHSAIRLHRLSSLMVSAQCFLICCFDVTGHYRYRCTLQNPRWSK